MSFLLISNGMSYLANSFIIITELNSEENSPLCLPKEQNCYNNDMGLYAIGDGAGITRGLQQASANGLYVADCILGTEGAAKQ